MEAVQRTRSQLIVIKSSFLCWFPPSDTPLLFPSWGYLRLLLATECFLCWILTPCASKSQECGLKYLWQANFNFNRFCNVPFRCFPKERDSSSSFIFIFAYSYKYDNSPNYTQTLDKEDKIGGERTRAWMKHIKQDLPAPPIPQKITWLSCILINSWGRKYYMPQRAWYIV